MISLSDSSPLSAPLLILISLPIFGYCLFMLFTKSGNKTAPSPPGPRGLPILGYLPFLRPDMHIQFTELARRYGPIYKLRLGTKLCYVISSPSLIKEVLHDHDTIFANHDSTVAGRIVSFNENDINFCPYNSSWRTRRKLFVHYLQSNSSLDATSNLRKDEVRKAIRNIYAKINTPVKISELASGIFLNAAMSMVWGDTIEGEKKDKIGSALSSLVARAGDLLGKPNVSDYLPVLARFDIQGVEKEFNNIMQRVDEIFEDIINERTKAGGGGGNNNGGRVDFLQMLMELSEKQDVKTEIGKTQIKGLIADIILGGTDTSSTTIEWVMDDFMDNPEVMEKAYRELNEVVGLNNVVEEFHISKLVYLDAIIKESLRIHPIGPLLSRTSSQSCIVGGYSIPKDSTVIVNIWSTQRDPLAWDNPSEFRPERFLGNSKKWNFSGKNFNYIPFGSGRRICAGVPLAEKMLRYVLASLLHSFDWQLPKGEILDREDIFGIVTKRRTPLVAIPSPRLSDKNLYV